MFLMPSNFKLGLATGCRPIILLWKKEAMLALADFSMACDVMSSKSASEEQKSSALYPVAAGIDGDSRGESEYWKEEGDSSKLLVLKLACPCP